MVSLEDLAGRAVAQALARGVARMFAHHGFTSVFELTLANGRRVDVAALGADGTLLFVEIKSSLADFRADAKWSEYADHCDGLFFAVPEDFPRGVLPEDVGLIVADAYGGEILREAPVLALAPARRRAVLLRFAFHAADRLRRVLDPGSAEDPR